MILPGRIREIFAASRCLHSKQEVEAALDRMAAEMNASLAETNPIFLCVVIGGIIPLGNLLPRLDFPLSVDYVHATRYGSSTKGGKLEWRVKPTHKLKDRTIVIVDDILDGGITLAAIVKHCREHEARHVYTAVLVDKETRRMPEGHQKADYTGLTVEDSYVFGYGMDYNEYLRNAPGIYAISPEHL